MGIHGHKNGAGGFYFLALPLFFLAIFDRRIAQWPYTAMFASVCAVGLLLFSRSKTAIGLFALTTICLIALSTLRWMRQYKGVFALIYLLIAAAAAVGALSAGLADTIDFLTGDPTFTGRVAIWQYVLSRWEESPYFGQGFGALWQVGPEIGARLRAAQLSWLMNEAHNGYLDVLAQTGIIGLLLVGVVLFSGFLIVLFAREEKSGPLNAWKRFGIYVTLGISFYNVTESTFIYIWLGGLDALRGYRHLRSFFQRIFRNSPSQGELICSSSECREVSFEYYSWQTAFPNAHHNLNYELTNTYLRYVAETISVLTGTGEHKVSTYTGAPVLDPTDEVH